MWVNVDSWPYASGWLAECFVWAWLECSLVLPHSNAVKLSDPIVKNHCEKQHCCEHRTCFSHSSLKSAWMRHSTAGLRETVTERDVHDGTTLAASFGACPLRWLFHLWGDSCRLDDTHSGNTNLSSTQINVWSLLSCGQWKYKIIKKTKGLWGNVIYYKLVSWSSEF